MTVLAAIFLLSSTSATTRPPRSGPKSISSNSSKKKISKKRGRRERGQKAPNPDRIKEIQQALAKDGSYSGTPTGKWDETTVGAMKNFQAGHGLSPTGKVDAKSLQKLGLGSEIAGVAAPMPAETAATSSPNGTRRQ